MEKNIINSNVSTTLEDTLGIARIILGNKTQFLLTGMNIKFGKNIILCFAIVLFTFTNSNIAAAASNVVVIMTDDLDEASLDRLQSQGLMPNLQQHLTDQGTRFSNSFVSTAWCCPSRATFFTGLYSHNHEVLTNGSPFGGVVRFDDTSTLATWLHDAGYRTGLVGKYLNGYGRDSNPNTPLDDASYIPPGWDDWQSIIHQQVFKLYDYTISDNGVLVHYGTEEADYQTDVIANRAVEFIEEAEALNDAQPFFLLVGTITPHLEVHGPTLTGCSNDSWNQTIRPAPRHINTLPNSIHVPQPPSFNEADVSDKPNWYSSLSELSTNDIACLDRQYRDRMEAMRSVDDLIGTVVDALIQNDELDDTVVIFTSDNGFFFGEHRLGDKVHVYEEAIRVPLLLRTPDISGPQSTDRMVLNNDLAPTIAAIANISPGLPTDGRSILPLLQNPQLNNWRKQVLVEYRGDSQFDVRYGPREPFSAIRTSPLADIVEHVYVEYDDFANRELYDLTSDSYQISSQHDNPVFAGIKTQLSELLSDLKTCEGATCVSLENSNVNTNPGEIGDRVWLDGDGNGIQDNGESGVSNVSVQLKDCGGGLLETTLTDSVGKFRFSNLAAGQYEIVFNAPTGFVFSPQSQGNKRWRDSNPDTNSGTTTCINLANGQTRLGIDAGLIESAMGDGRIGNFAWTDIDADGIQHASEPGHPNVAVKLRACGGNIIASTTTDANGNYLFEHVTPGRYALEFIPPAGFTLSPWLAGTKRAKDSNPNPNTGLTRCITMPISGVKLGIDAGLVQ